MYYHIMKKSDEWHLYRGHDHAPLLVDRYRAIVLREARRLARQNRFRVVVHPEPSPARAMQEKCEL